MIDRRSLMRAWSGLICVFAVSFACIADTVGAEQDDNSKAAEAAFKNIQVLKGINASELIPTMVFIRSSLGVECNFCHVNQPKWSPELDQKEEKKTARGMILMMRQINQQNFNGETRVTCATCHQGHSRPGKTPPLMEKSKISEAETEAAKPNEHLPETGAIFARYEAAIGGETAIAKLTSRVEKAAGKTAAGKTFEEEFYQSAPDKMLSRTIQDMTEETYGYDGARGWVKNKWGVFDLTSSDSGIAEIKVSANFWRNLKLAPQYEDATVMGKAKISDHDVYVVRGRLIGGLFSDLLYFDTQSGLLLRRVTLERSALGDVPRQADFSDYREVQGVKVPFAVREADPDSLTTKTYSDIEFNIPVSDKTFAKPPKEMAGHGGGKQN
jgi:hypothetical protein